MIKTVIIIPARFKSSRLPGKPLKKILGKEMILWVAKKSEKVAGKKNVFIATDDERIKKVVVKNSYNCIMTSSKCLTGTDRVAEASRKINADIYINVQGDEPLIKTNDIKKIIDLKKKIKQSVICGFSTLNKNDSEEIPKVVMNKYNELVYASRLKIPANKIKSKNVKYFKQVCVYAFNKTELKKFSRKKKSSLEKYEDIELLRFLDLGVKIKMKKISASSFAVENKADLKRVNKFLSEK